MKQIKVSLPDDLRDQLEKAAAKAGRSLSEEVRERLALPDDVRSRIERAANKAEHSIAAEISRRLARTFEDDAIEAETRQLIREIQWLADLVAIQTGHDWFSHPAAVSIMKHAIDGRLARMKGGDGNAVFGPDELPSGEDRWVVGSDDPKMMAMALDAVVESHNVWRRTYLRDFSQESGPDWRRALRAARKLKPATEEKEKKG